MANVHWGLSSDGEMRRPAPNLALLVLGGGGANSILLAPLLILVTGRKALAALILTLVVLALVPRPHGSLMWALQTGKRSSRMALATPIDEPTRCGRELFLRFRADWRCSGYS